MIATQTGPSFEILEANYTGMEAFSATTDLDFYVHNQSLTLTVVISDLFIGTEYELNYNMCDVYSTYDYSGYKFYCGSDTKYGVSDDPSSAPMNRVLFMCLGKCTSLQLHQRTLSKLRLHSPVAVEMTCLHTATMVC